MSATPLEFWDDEDALSSLTREDCERIINYPDSQITELGRKTLRERKF